MSKKDDKWISWLAIALIFVGFIAVVVLALHALGILQKMVLGARKAIIYLDMWLLVMTAVWILFGVAQGVDFIELGYNYLYVIIMTITLLLNMKLLKE